ncbi:hypothetical protein ACIPZF_01010 [Pseudomonas sp. NPDC089752]|uniref:hypothetical protein n=1 Tax=Pseudomonas sp. NPDC089752 TaxID=3364472 RepID=UPI00380B8748
MSQSSPFNTHGPIVRPRLIWRLLFVLVCLLGAFLYFSLLCFAGYLLMLGFDGEHPSEQRLVALGSGGLILFVALWLLKVAMPRRFSPLLVERER